MTLLKDLGYGSKYIESRISIELDDLIEKIRKIDGRPFNPHDMVYHFVNGIIMSFMFGRQFDHDNDPLMQHVNKVVDLIAEILNPELYIFPILIYCLRKYRNLLNRILDSQR